MASNGAFLPWVETLPFTDQTARNYLRLFQYNDKIKNVLNLQEAYRQIESFEAVAFFADGAGGSEFSERIKKRGPGLLLHNKKRAFIEGGKSVK